MRTLQYSVIVTENKDGKISEILVPDLIKRYGSEPGTLLSLNSTKKDLEQYLQSLRDRNIKIPVPKNRNDEILTEQQYETKLFINLDDPPGCFEKNLPRFGLFVTFGSVICAGISVVLSLIATGDEETTDRTSGITLAVFGVFFSFSVQIIDYLFSTSSRFYREVGKAIDDRIANKSEFSEPSPPKIGDTSANAKLYSMYVLIALIVMGDVVLVGSMSPFRASKALTQQAIDSGFKIFDGMFINLYPWFVAIFNGSAGFSFHAGFAARAARKWSDYASKRYFSKSPSVTSFSIPKASYGREGIESKQLLDEANHSDHLAMA